MKASELIKRLQELIEEYGDAGCWVEGNDCSAFCISNVKYNKHDKDFQLC